MCEHGHKLEIILGKFVYLFAELVNLIRIHTHSRGERMSAVSVKAVCGAAYRLYHREALYAAGGASGFVAVVRNKHAGFAGVLHNLCTDDSDYAVVPTLTLYYNNSVVKNIRFFGIELVNLRRNLLFKLLTAVVLLAKVARKLLGAFVIIGCKQLRSLIRGTQARGGIKLWRNAEGNHLRSQLFACKSGLLHKGTQSGIRRFGNERKSLPHQNPVFSGQRNHVRHRADAYQIGVLLRNAPAVIIFQCAYKLERNAHSGKVAVNFIVAVLIAAVRINNGDGVRQNLPRFVVVGDNHVKPEGSCVVDFLDGGNTVVNGYDEVGFPRRDKVNSVFVKTVAFVLSVRNIVPYVAAD